MSKILTLTATGVAGLVLGAGIGIAAAAADQGNRPAAPERVQDVSSMDEMHDAMRDQMPADLVEQCDQMHAAMADGHAEHHPGTEG